MEKGETQIQKPQTEVKLTPTSASEPHLWNNLLKWCNSDLQDQMKRVNARPHECKTCGKRFTLLENLNRHQMIHTNQRPFHCPYCSKSFRLSQHLKEHIRIHTGEKPYKCHICGHAFCQISNLKSHQKTHTKVKGFRCDQCGKEFRRSFTLKQHKLTHAKSAKSNPKPPNSVNTSTTLYNGNNTSAPFRTDMANVMATNSESNPQLAMLSDVKENMTSKPQPTSPSGTLMYNNLMGSFPTKKEANNPQKEKEEAQFMSLWNTIYQINHGEKSDKTKNPIFSEYFRLADKNGRNNATTCSNITKFLDLANSNQLKSNGVNQRPNSLFNLPFLQSSQWKASNLLNQTPFNLSVRKPSRDGTSPSTSHALTTKTPPSSDVSAPKNKIQDQHPAFDNVSRKRKQTQSLNDSAVSCTTLFDDFSTKNNHLFSRTRPYKSLTASQDYNWKRQLCREWQQIDNKGSLDDKERSSSADLPRDSLHKPTLTPPCVDPKELLKGRLVKSENQDSVTRASTSFDDDVFSPLCSSSSAPPRDSTKSNLPAADCASRLNSVFQDHADIFQYPYIPSAKKYRKHTESLKDGPKSSSSDLSSNKSPSNYICANLHPLLRTTEYTTPKQNDFSPRTTNNEILNYNKVLEPKTPSPLFPTSSPLFDFKTASCFSDPLATSKLPLSPHFKSFSDRLSFIPLVTWKPVVTGWRNVLDGNVYPARIGVDNMNPFSLQQQIS